MQTPTSRPLALVTGASSGIGLELAKLCARDGFDLLVAADQPLKDIARDGEELGIRVEPVMAELATSEGVDLLIGALGDRRVDVLIANAGHGLGKGFLDQDIVEAQHVVDTNISGTIRLIHRIGNGMRSAGRGRILITGSIAGFMPGTFQAVYNGTKAFIDSFSWALRNELKDTGVTVTCLMPGPTDTEFFERADLLDTKVGASESKMSAAEVAQIGFDAMMRGEGDVVAGFRNKLQAAMANVTPAAVLAERHRKMAEPGSAH
jgi:short-subunit dehydrogenase